MSEVEFLPGWYARRQRLRQRIMAVMAILLVLLGWAFAAWSDRE